MCALKRRRQRRAWGSAGDSRLIELLRMEAHRDYSPGAAPASDNWWGFPSRSVSLEALMLLHGTEVVGVLDEVLAMDTWPHGIDAVKRARTVFA